MSKCFDTRGRRGRRRSVFLAICALLIAVPALAQPIATVIPGPIATVIPGPIATVVVAPTAVPTRRPTATPTAASSPTPVPTAFSGGEVAVTTIADSHASGSETVDAGHFQITNTSGSTVTLETITIAASRPVVLSSLTLTVSSLTTNQTVTVANLSASNAFNFSTIEIPSGGDATCALAAAVTSSTANFTLNSIADASSPGGSPGGTALAVGIAAILLWALTSIRRVRGRVAATLLLFAVWIGIYAGCGSEQSSAQTVENVTAKTSEGGPVTFDGVPASLGTVSLPEPLVFAGSAAATPTASSSTTSTPGTPGPTSATRTGTPSTPTPGPSPTATH